MSPPPSKRKRSLSPTDPPTAIEDNLTRSPDIYLVDGNVVLIAESTAFRVHKSVLGRHSVVFRDMFACGNQPKDAEFFDGCPVVRLSDTYREVRILLQALYDNTQFDMEHLSPVVTVFRISTNYLMESTCLSAMKILRQAYPDTLKVWDASTDYPGIPCTILRLDNTKVLRPAAYYELCRKAMDQVPTGTDDLPWPIFKLYCRGKDKIAVKLAQFFQHHFLNRKEGSSCDKSCRASWKLLEMEMQLMILENINSPQPIESLSSLSREECISGMCQECRLKLMDNIEKEREAIWTSLPETFELGTWEELRKGL